MESHDTFGRVFRLLKSEAFEDSFQGRVNAISEISQGQVIAIDGKELRCSMDGTLGKRAIHIVNLLERFRDHKEAVYV